MYYYVPNGWPTPYAMMFGGTPLFGQFHYLHHGYMDSGQYVMADLGPNPLAVNINRAARNNRNFRTALWTGKHLQVTLMSINPGEDIGLEIHRDLDQFLRVEQGRGVVLMGKNRYRPDYHMGVGKDSAIMVPAGTWHNVINTGSEPLKLYSIYAPPEHPHGTVHATKKEALEAEEDHRKKDAGL